MDVYCEKHEWPAGMEKPCPDCTELAALQAKLDTAHKAADGVERELERMNLQVEEARKIIVEVSHLPEMKKWFDHFSGTEQDPLGVHAFLEKYADKQEQDGLRLGESRNLPYPRPISDDDAKKRKDVTDNSRSVAEVSICVHKWAHIEDGHYFCPLCRATEDR